MGDSLPDGRSTEAIRGDIEAAFGFLPPFFEPALMQPAVLEGLWQHTLWSYVRNPLPELFKERVLAFAGRYCSVPYCMVSHASALRPLGLSGNEVLTLLDAGPTPGEAIAVLERAGAGQPWPAYGTLEDQAVFACAVAAFGGGQHAASCQAALAAALTAADFQHLTALLAWARACHSWAEANPSIDYRDDERARRHLPSLLAEAPWLNELFATYGARVADERAARERELALGLADSRQRFRQIFDYAPIGTAIRSLDGRFVQVNQAMCEITGYDAEVLLGSYANALTHPDDRTRDSVLAAELLAGTRDWYQLEKRYIRADGRAIWVEIRCSLVRDGYGEPLSVVGHVVDIDEQRRTQEALLASESSFRSAFEDAIVGMCLTLPSGRLTRVNRRMCELLGRSEEELLGSGFKELSHPDDRARDAANVRSILAGERGGGSWEKRYIHASGRSVWVELSTSLVRDEAGEPLYFVTQVSDISARKRADQLKDEFIATVSHELRSPLTSIQGYVELLAEEPRSERDQGWLDVIGRNSQRLRRLVDDLLFIAQARAETVTVERADVDLCEVLRESVQVASPRAAERDVWLALDSEPLVIANGDAGRIGQAIDNLISNALKYTHAGGRIDVSVERRGEMAVVTVADTGIGMTAADRQRLFERFFRASTAIDAAIPGVGLGLSIVKTIVDLHGGEIAVDSTEGVGTTFEVRLPIGPARGGAEAWHQPAGAA